MLILLLVAPRNPEDGISKEKSEVKYLISTAAILFALPALAQNPNLSALQDQLTDTTSELRLTEQALANATHEFLAERVATLKLQNALGQVSQESSAKDVRISEKDKKITEMDKQIADLEGQISSAEKSEKAAVGAPPDKAPDAISKPDEKGSFTGKIEPPATPAPATNAGSATP